MRIGICDDEDVILDELKILIEKCLESLNINGEVLAFCTGEKVIEEAENLDVLFLDIEMPKMDGIKLGYKLRERSIDCKIIMATCRTERFKEAFKIDAYDFVTKPFDEEEIKDVLKRVHRSFLNMKIIEAYKERSKCEVYLKNIIYIIAIDSCVELVSKESRYRKETSLTQLESLLDDRFFFALTENILLT